MFKRVVLLILLFCGSVRLAVAQTLEKEASLKAVFIYNFTRYVEWTLNADESEFIIGVVGNSVIDASLDEIARTSTVNSKKILIKRFSKPEEISYCHILFIPANTTFPLQSILEKTSKGVLTIGEESGYAKMGTAFNFVLVNEKLKFEANLKVLDAEGLKVSSQLLKLAIIIN